MNMMQLQGQSSDKWWEKGSGGGGQRWHNAARIHQVHQDRMARGLGNVGMGHHGASPYHQHSRYGRNYGPPRMFGRPGFGSYASRFGQSRISPMAYISRARAYPYRNNRYSMGGYVTRGYSRSPWGYFQASRRRGYPPALRYDSSRYDDFSDEEDDDYEQDYSDDEDEYRRPAFRRRRPSYYPDYDDDDEEDDFGEDDYEWGEENDAYYEQPRYRPRANYGHDYGRLRDY